MKTVKELKEFIADLPDDMTLWFTMASGCCGDFEELDNVEVSIQEPSKNYSGAVHFDFSSLPGYRSCIQVGGTKRAHEEYWKQIDGPSNPDDSREEGDSN